MKHFIKQAQRRAARDRSKIVKFYKLVKMCKMNCLKSLICRILNIGAVTTSAKHTEGPLLDIGWNHISRKRCILFMQKQNKILYLNKGNLIR